MFKAEVIAASRNTFGDRITTMLVTYPRMIHTEMCRHRMFSRNTASSRAIPFLKMVEAVEKNPFIPIKWMKEHKGMQGIEYIPEDNQYWAKEAWLVARDQAVYQAKLLNERYEVTHQMCNRLLEPFMWTTEIITATEWENFFKLRIDPAADIHIQSIAELMLIAYNDTKVEQLKPGEWHIPYKNKINDDDIIAYCKEHVSEKEKADGSKDLWDIIEPYFIKVSTAMCAGTSYTVFSDVAKELRYPKLIDRHDDLLVKKHMSPFEHCAQSMDNVQYNSYGKFEGHPGYYHENHNYGWCKNFRGFIQYRAMIDGENQSDSRVKH